MNVFLIKYIPIELEKSHEFIHKKEYLNPLSM